jgi:nickel-dependent lactate racemase
MLVDVPYGESKIQVVVEDARVAGIVRGNPVPAGNEEEKLRLALEHPLNSKNLRDFLINGKNILFIVNDATRPTPTARILEGIFRIAQPAAARFMIATGAHRRPTEPEYRQIFGRFYEELKPRVHAHDARNEKDMVYIGTSRNGTPLYVNKMAMEADRLVIISSVEPHYFAGYTGGRKSFFPGIAAYRSIEINHRAAMDPGAASLALEGNPVHEDMIDALKSLEGKDIFTVMTVLDNEHRIYAATAGHINDAFFAAVAKAKEVFAVPIKEKAEVVVTAARFPMDIDLYQAQKALEHGKLALKKGGILILVASCRAGTGDKTFIDLLSACPTPGDVFKKIKEGYVLGYHKAAKMAEINLWAEMYGVTELPDQLLESILIKPYHSLQRALDEALARKGTNAKVLFMVDGSVTVPIPEKG